MSSDSLCDMMQIVNPAVIFALDSTCRTYKMGLTPVGGGIYTIQSPTRNNQHL